MLHVLRKYDSLRIKRAEKKQSAVFKKKQKGAKRRKAKAEKRKRDAEGPTYGAGEW